MSRAWERPELGSWAGELGLELDNTQADRRSDITWPAQRVFVAQSNEAKLTRKDKETD